MKVSILVINIVLPMTVSIGLYCYALLSSRWTSINHNAIIKHNLTNQQREYLVMNNQSIQLQKRLLRHAFRSQLSLFGYCLDYKWIYLYTINSDKHDLGQMESHSILSPELCNSSFVYCPETKSCVKRCDDAPLCPSYIDQEMCDHIFNRTHYYLKDEKCIWRQTISIDLQGVQDYFSFKFSSSTPSSRDRHNDLKRIRHSVMILLFIASPLLTFMALLILLCINCV
ncbi:unnamed protein product, partial [Adineta ricciae]